MKIIGPPGGFGRFDRNPPPREGFVVALKENGTFCAGVREAGFDFASQIPFYSFFKIFSEEQRAGVEKIRKMALVLSELSGLDFERSLSSMEKSVSTSSLKGLSHVFSEAASNIQAALSSMSFERRGRVLYPLSNDLGKPVGDSSSLSPIRDLANQVDEKYTEIRGLIALGTVLEKRLKIFSFFSAASEQELEQNYESAVSLLSNPFFPDVLRQKSLAYIDSKFDSVATKEMLGEVNSHSLQLNDELTRLAYRYLKERNNLADRFDVSEFDQRLESPMVLASKGLLDKFCREGAQSILDLGSKRDAEVRAFKKPLPGGKGPLQ